MYKCSVCDAVSQPGQSRKVYVVYRDDGTIEEEIPVCRDCLADLPESKPMTLADRVCREREIQHAHRTAYRDIPPAPDVRPDVGHVRPFGYVSGPRGRHG
jgi:hypothetical protein